MIETENFNDSVHFVISASVEMREEKDERVVGKVTLDRAVSVRKIVVRQTIIAEILDGYPNEIVESGDAHDVDLIMPLPGGLMPGFAFGMQTLGNGINWVVKAGELELPFVVHPTALLRCAICPHCKVRRVPGRIEKVRVTIDAMCFGTLA